MLEKGLLLNSVETPGCSVLQAEEALVRWVAYPSAPAHGFRYNDAALTENAFAPPSTLPGAPRPSQVVAPAALPRQAGVLTDL